MNKILLGPYIGDFKHEIEEFYPFVCWFRKNISDNFFYSTHLNRKFIYDKKDGYIPFYEILSREEEKQNGYLHDDINPRDYVSLIVKNIKEEISNDLNCLKKDLLHYNLSYVKFTSKIPLCQKYFKPIPFDKVDRKIVFIPDDSWDKNDLSTILNYLKTYYDEQFLVIGDTKTHFKKENIILNRFDYFENGYINIINYISNAKLVITPCSHWTLLANIQKVPVLSWGNENIGMYKDNGCYTLNNKKCCCITYTNIDNIIKQIDKIMGE